MTEPVGLHAPISIEGGSNGGRSDPSSVLPEPTQFASPTAGESQ